MKQVVFLVVLLLPLLQSCGLKEREDRLNKREAALARREQALLERENELALQAKDLQQRLDSTRNDTAAFYHPAILGQWNTVMTCTETTCPGSAVGDTKSETWVFSYEQNYLVAKAMVNDKVIRIYTGTDNRNKVVELTATVEPSATVPATKIIVRLNPAEGNTMDGQREIVREGGCRILYSLKLTRI